MAEDWQAAAGSPLERLMQRVDAWAKAGRPRQEWLPAYTLLAGSLVEVLERCDDDLLADLLESIADPIVSNDLLEMIQALTDLSPWYDPEDGTPRIQELFALPVRVFFAGQEEAWVLGKPVGPNVMAPIERGMEMLLGAGAHAKLLPGFFERDDLLSPWPSGAWQIRSMLGAQLKGETPRVHVTPAASPLHARGLRRSFVRFVVGVLDRPFSGGRTLSERRFAPDHLSRWKLAIAEDLNSLLATMGKDIQATVSHPDILSRALTREIRF